MKTKRENSAFITIQPIAPEYRQILAAAIKHRDTEALEALKGNTHKPIRFVKQMFLYQLMTMDHDQSPYVTIYSVETRQNWNRFQHTIKHRDAQEVYTAPRLTIPEDIYDFLL